MNTFPGLNWIERLAVRLLHRSRNISLLVIKHRDIEVIGWSYAYDDATAIAAIKQLRQLEVDYEPASHLLERLYHAPSYGED